MTRNVTPTVQTYTYDEENRLTGAAGYTYTYDGDGNRVRKSNGNLAANGTLYWYMTPGVVAESDLAGTLKSEYVFFDGERVARRDGATGTGGVFYYFSDHLKTASVITDSAGVIKAKSDYYPWGGELQFVNNDSNDYKFTGKKRDTETGLDYFGARYYSNGLGRWVSADLVRILSGEARHVSVLKGHAHAELENVAAGISGLALTLKATAVRRVLSDLSEKRITPVQAQEWASFVMREYMPSREGPIRPISVEYEPAQEEQIVEAVSRLEQLGDLVDGVIDNDELRELLEALEG
jgi:RHS repeat-associated protein